MWSRFAYLLDRYLSDPGKLCFIDLAHTRGLAAPNIFTRYYERMIIFGHYSIFGDPVVRIPSASVLQAQPFRSNLSSLSNNQLVYVSVIAHKFWHATMQMPGTQHLGLGEADAFAAQAIILEELGGDPQAVEYWVLQSKAAWDRSIWQSVLEAALARLLL